MDNVFDDKAGIAEVLQQAPPHVEYNDVKLAYYKARRNISQALADLWNLPPLPEKKKPVGENAEKWEEVRNICDEFDAAATEALHEIMKRQHSGASGASVNPDNGQSQEQAQVLASPIIRSCDNS
jgi:hypothetical protein